MSVIHKTPNDCDRAEVRIRELEAALAESQDDSLVVSVLSVVTMVLIVISLLWHK